ncbi:acid protease protein [Rutstroemia sp. NJR-2017a BVV2]|nr:acid protease protein [Rutstroemia sp. NJR-2017a BVV2]
MSNPSEGVDGEWSTFNLRIGTPAQSVRVIASTNSPATLVVLPGGCTTNAIDPVPSDCASSRGGTFNNELSTSWDNQGIFGINGVSYGFEANLGYDFDAQYGLDTLGLGYADGADSPVLKNQTVAAYGMASPLYTGIFGLGTQPVIYQTFGNISVPSFFRSLRDQKLIPSLSWSYTAGAKYRLKAGQFAQLIFGGYDTSRFQPNSVSFSINADVTRDLLVGIQSIIYQGETSTALLPSPIYAFVESTDPNIWLPKSACLLFEKAFGLTWNDTLSMYLLNSTQHTLLSGSNPTVTFSLANTISGGSTVNIQLPFSAFALRASYPFVSNDTYYFPLKRASNETQYTLGRTFLQEAYLTVDYDRGNFSIHQCSWIDGAASTIIPIESPSSTSRNGTSDTDHTHSSTSVKPGLIIGIVFGVLAFLGLVLALILFLLRRQRLTRHKRHSQLLASHHALTNMQTRNDDKGLDTKHSSINTNISSTIKSTNSHYDQQQQSPNPSTFPDKLSPHIQQQQSPSLYPHSSFYPQTPTPSELDSHEKQIHQLPGESRKWELGNTDTGYRYELESKRSGVEEVLPAELPAEEPSPPENALTRAMRMSELVSPTLGPDERYIRLGSEPRPGLLGPGPHVQIRVDGPQSYQERFPDATPTTMSTAPSFLNHDYNQNNTFYNGQRESQSTRRTSGWRASSFLRGRDSSSMSPGGWTWSAETPRPVSESETTLTVSTPATARRWRAAGFI